MGLGLKQLMVGPPFLRLAVAESLTSGNVQAAIGAESGVSVFFLGGITAYTLEQKVHHLGVDRGLAEACDCVSDEVARQMAIGVCHLFGSDLGVATTGYAEPAPTRGVDVPFAYWGIARVSRGAPATVRTGRLDLPGLARTDVQRAVTHRVIQELSAFVNALR